MQGVSVSIIRDGDHFHAQLELDGTAEQEKVATTIRLLLAWSAVVKRFERFLVFSFMRAASSSPSPFASV